ncbi:MAG: hypothetical protein JWM80_3808 [Cyanobacteria bacterium RYN_339]|nr:hypothetical protein [Cyanobacteria bacterium RYN_339]
MQAKVMQWMSAMALAAAWTGAPALACPDHQGGNAPGTSTANGGAQCENGVCKVEDHQVAHADKHESKGEKDCCKDGKGECCKNEAKKDAKAECCDAEEGHGKMAGKQQRMGHHRMGGHHMGGQRGAEIRYMPGMGIANGSNNSFVVLGGGMQMGGDIFSVGLQHNLAVQLNPTGGAGNWIAPYCGIVPRLGVQLGTARVDVGVLGGFGGMVRTLGGVTPGAQVLDARLQWVVEPRIELGMKNEKMGVSLVAAYLLTPNMADIGGVSAGLKFTFKGHKM